MFVRAVVCNCAVFCVCMCTLGVTKVVTVDIRGSWQRWLKVRDLTKGVTYCFRVQAKTIAYGPEAEANITAGPVKGELHNQTNIPTKTDQQTSQGCWAQLTFPTPQREVSEIQAVKKHQCGSISHSGVGVWFSFRHTHKGQIARLFLSVHCTPSSLFRVSWISCRNVDHKDRIHAQHPLDTRRYRNRTCDRLCDWNTPIRYINQNMLLIYSLFYLTFTINISF